MIRVNVDISDVERMLRRAERKVAKSGETMHKIADKHATRAARQRKYTDRTGDMTAETNADVVSHSDNETVVVFGSTVPYASFLEEGGWSSLGEHAPLAEDEIQETFEEQASEYD